ncbi:MAG: Mrp/NBP35 family ATP-binding protein [Syntrophomonadaceae bacterium]|nr:Mrp/NBP35 family ATP-binding protein [Syntrophomonadaceae bacterium]
MSEKCSTCPSSAGCAIDPASCPSEEQNTLVGSLNRVRNVVAVMSGKGGVGKSSVTGLIAAELAKSGNRVGVLDADITGPSQPRAFGIPAGIGLKGTEYGIIPPLATHGIKVISVNFFLPNEDDPVVWRGPMLAGAVKQFWGEVDWGELDYMIVDLPPGTGDVPLTVLQSLPISGLVIVSSPQDLAAMVVKKTIKMAQKMNIPIIGLVENMSYAICPSCTEKLEIFGKSQGKQVAQASGIDFLGGIPWDMKLNDLIDHGKIVEYNSPDISNIVEKIVSKLP